MDRMRRRRPLLILGMLGMLALGGGDVLSIAKSTCRFHRYFAELKTADHISPLERLLISLVLAQTPEPQRGKI
jgi:hypothetical protein